MNSKSKTVANLGIIAALITAALIIDTALSAALPIKIAAASITVVLVICQTKDLKTAVFASTTFGILSLLRAVITPSLTSTFFLNPLISVAPRIVVGFTCYFSLKLFKNIFKKPKNNITKALPYIFSGAIGVFTNTILVLSMLAVFGGGNVLAKIIAGIIAFNFLTEFLCGIIIVPVVSQAILRVRKNIDSKDINVNNTEETKDNGKQAQEQSTNK